MPNSRSFPLALAAALAMTLQAGSDPAYPTQNSVVIDNTGSRFEATVNLRGSFSKDPEVRSDKDASPGCQYQVSGGGVSGVSDFRNITRIALKPGATLTLTFSNNFGKSVTSGILFKSTTVTPQDGCSYDLSIQDKAGGTVYLKARREIGAGAATLSRVGDGVVGGSRTFTLAGNQVVLKGKGLYD